MTIDATKTSPEKLAEMNDSLIIDNQYLRGRVQSRQLISPSDHRLIEIVRAFITTNSTEQTRPTMNDEHHLLTIMQLAVDETRAINQVLADSKEKWECFHGAQRGHRRQPPTYIPLGQLCPVCNRQKCPTCGAEK